MSEVELDSKIIGQYNNINSPQPQAPQGEPEVIKLFED